MSQITAEIYQAFKIAIEIGKWPDGRVLSAEQKETVMDAIIAYEIQHVDETDRTGFIDRGHKQDGEMCDDTTQIIKFDK